MAENIEKTEEQIEESSEHIYTFRTPLEYNGKSYESVTYDLEKLTGQDSMDVEAELLRLKKGIVIEGYLNTDYIIRIFCKACKEKIGADAFSRMSLKDFNRIKALTRNFLIESAR